MKKLPHLLRYVLDRCKTQQMCDKATLENDGSLKTEDCSWLLQKSRNT